MVRASYDQKPYRRSSWRRTARKSCRARQGDELRAPGPRSVARQPGFAGSRSQAVEDAAGRDDTKYALGSVLDRVLLHRTVIGQEALGRCGSPASRPTSSSAAPGVIELRRSDLPSSVAISARGRTTGSSRSSEAARHSPRRVRLGIGARRNRPHRQDAHARPRLRAEPIHGVASATTGCRFVSLLKEHGYIEARSVHQRSTFEAGVQFAKARGSPAPSRPRHPVAIDEALDAARPAKPRSSCSTCWARPLRPKCLRALYWRA